MLSRLVRDPLGINPTQKFKTFAILQYRTTPAASSQPAHYYRGYKQTTACFTTLNIQDICSHDGTQYNYYNYTHIKNTMFFEYQK